MIFALYDTGTNRVTNWREFSGLTLDALIAALPPGRSAVQAAQRIEGPCEVLDGEVVSIPVDASEILLRDKARSAFEVNNTIGAVRRTIATDTAFQAQAYLNKRAEAEAYLALTPPPATLDAFPLLKELTVARGMSAADLAQLWLDTNNEWTPVLNQTEILRDSTVFAINSATTRAEIDAAVAAFNTALNAISTPGETP